MKKSEKIITTVLIIIGYIIIAGLLQVSIEASGGGGRGIIGLMLIGVIFGIRSIWKSKNDNKDSDDLPSKS